MRFQLSTFMLGVLATSAAHAQTLTKLFQDGSSPTTTYDSKAVKLVSYADADARYGSFAYVDVGHRQRWGAVHGLFAFDIRDIPVGSEIRDVSLTVYHDVSSAAATMVTLDLHELTQAFVENETNWTFAQNNVPWRTSGGTYEPKILSSISLSPATVVAGQFSVFSGSYNFRSAVQRAHESSKVVYLLVKLRDESGDAERMFRLRSDNHDIKATRPTLSVTYAPQSAPVVASFGGGDSTGTIRAAIDSGAARVVIPLVKVNGVPADWVISDTIQLRDNQELQLEEGVRVRAKLATLRTDQKMFVAEDKTNVRVVGLGSGATFMMNRGDYSNVAEQEHGHCLAFLGAKNAEVTNMKFEDCSGDGVYVGHGKVARFSDNVLITNVHTKRALRNGLSITSAKNVVVDNSSFNDATHFPNGRKLPNAGIDLEPNTSAQPIWNILIRNTRVEGNGLGNGDFGYGFVAALNTPSQPANPVLARFLDCTAFNNRTGFTASAKLGTPGLVEIIRGVSDTSTGPGIEIGPKIPCEPGASSCSYELNFIDCKVRNAGTVTGGKIEFHSGQLARSGGVNFSNCFVQDNTRAWFMSHRTETTAQLSSIFGNFIVDNPHGARVNLGTLRNSAIDWVLGDGVTPMRIFVQGVAPKDSYTEQHAAQLRSNSSTPDNNGNMVVGYNNAKIRSVLSFDISDIPIGKTIDTVQLQLTHVEVGQGTSPVAVNLYAMTNSFNEAETTWSFARSGVRWNTEGGDFSSTVLSTVTAVPSAVPRFSKLVFQNQNAFRDAVRRAYNGDKVVRLMVSLADESAAAGTRTFTLATDDWAPPDANGNPAGNATFRPRLIVTYTPGP
ncbi:MAG: DNRLRE domain-containing protein [Myxococcota bacterium]